MGIDFIGFPRCNDGSGVPGSGCLSSDAFALIDKLRAEFATDPPCQPALAWAALGQYDGEFRGNFEILGDDLDATGRDVGNRAVARQPATELDLRETFASATFAAASIHQHEFLALSDGVLRGSGRF